MAAPVPQTIANEIYMAIASIVDHAYVLDKQSAEYFVLRRRVSDLQKVSAEAGIGAHAALSALSGDVQGFVSGARQILSIGQSDIEKLYLILFANALGERRLSRQLIAAVSFSNLSELGRKIAMAHGLFEMERLQQILLVAQRAGIPEAQLPIKIEEIMVQEAILSIFKSLGISLDQWDTINAVAAKSALMAGIFLTVSPHIRYDVEDGFLSVAFDVPLDMEKIFEIEANVDELVAQTPDFPSVAVVSFHMVDEA